jgi:hypothetical protein
MRTTIVLDEDVAAAVEQLRRERAAGLSETVNELIRAGLRVRRPPRRFEQQTHHLDLRIDATNVAEALELLDGPASR